jgi:hypothetical protein
VRRGREEGMREGDLSSTVDGQEREGDARKHCTTGWAWSCKRPQLQVREVEVDGRDRYHGESKGRVLGVNLREKGKRSLQSLPPIDSSPNAQSYPQADL